MHVYLDYAAATPVDEDVLASMQPFYNQHYFNPSAIYQAALGVRKLLEGARSSVAKHCGVRPAEIIFTAGGTEANNLAILGVMRSHPGKHMVYSSLEHDSVIGPIQYLMHQGVTAAEIAPEPTGVLDPQKVVAAVNDDTVLVSVMLANNEIGTLQSVRQIAALLADIRRERLKAGNETPLYFHTDACQAVNYLDVNMHRLGVDLMTLNGGKIYGPKQSGVLAALSHVEIEPLLYGGGQEFGRRSGTENVANAIGFARALEKTGEIRNQEAERLKQLQRLFLSLLEKRFPSIIVNGSKKHRLPNNIHMTIPGMDNERLLFALDDRGVSVATGSACSASKAESSHVLRSLGLTDESARSSIRMTFGRQTTEAELMYVLEQLQDLL